MIVKNVYVEVEVETPSGEVKKVASPKYSCSLPNTDEFKELMDTIAQDLCHSIEKA